MKEQGSGSLIDRPIVRGSFHRRVALSRSWLSRHCTTRALLADQIFRVANEFRPGKLPLRSAPQRVDRLRSGLVADLPRLIERWMLESGRNPSYGVPCKERKWWQLEFQDELWMELYLQWTSQCSAQQQLVGSSTALTERRNLHTEAATMTIKQSFLKFKIEQV